MKFGANPLCPSCAYVMLRRMWQIKNPPFFLQMNIVVRGTFMAGLCFCTLMVYLYHATQPKQRRFDHSTSYNLFFKTTFVQSGQDMPMQVVLEVQKKSVLYCEILSSTESG